MPLEPSLPCGLSADGAPAAVPLEPHDAPCLALRTGAAMAPEAFVPKEDPAKEALYLRNYGRSLPFFSQLMLSLQDRPERTKELLKAHLTEATESAGLRKIVSTFPIKNAESDCTRPDRHREYFAMKTTQADLPTMGSDAYLMKQYGA